MSSASTSGVPSRLVSLGDHQIGAGLGDAHHVLGVASEAQDLHPGFVGLLDHEPVLDVNCAVS